MAASVLMTWTPHQERFPHSIDGNGSENGQQFSRSFETVKTHVVNATGKLGAQGRTQLVVKAIAHGLIDPSSS